MDDLLPCPFCGSAAEHGEIADDCMPPHPDQGGHFIQCTNAMCGASTNLRFASGDDPKPLLAEQWNRRSPKEAAQHDISQEAAREMLAALGQVMRYLDDGILVRDITKDASPDWGMKMLTFVRDLQAWQTAISKADRA